MTLAAWRGPLNQGGMGLRHAEMRPCEIFQGQDKGARSSVESFHLYRYACSSCHPAPTTVCHFLTRAQEPRTCLEDDDES
jgi:hypothetical protein